jgi:iron complex transport system permease protein
MVLFLVFALELALGSVHIPLGDVVSILTGSVDVDASWRRIVLLYRLPRALTAVLAGSALGMAGLKMQTLFRNPLADPYVLGISSGAHLGVAVVVLSAGGLGWTALAEKAGFLGNASMILAATLGALGAMAVVLAVARRVENSLTLLIIGIMIGYLSSAVVNILVQFALEHQLQAYVAWTFGSFGQVTWRQLGVFAPAILCGLGLCAAMTKVLNAMLLGEDYASSLGVDVRRARFLIIFGASLLAGVVTAYCGPVSFLGIAVPHLGRMLLRTSDHRFLTPAVILIGAVLALSADMLAQLPGAKSLLPLNSVTALIGAPVVVWVIMKRRQVMEAGV